MTTVLKRALTATGVLASMLSACRADTFTALGPVGGSVTGLIANGESNDGSVSVGTLYTSNSGPFPYTWHIPSTIGAQLPIGFYRAGACYGASQTGLYAAGFVVSSAGQYVPALWSGGLLGTLPLPSGVTGAEAVAVSGDGQTVIGVQLAGTATQPFYWSNGLVYTVSLPNGSIGAAFTNVTSDGQTLTGTVLQGSTQYAGLYSLANEAWTTFPPIANRNLARFLAATQNGTVAVGDCANQSNQGVLSVNQSVRLANGSLMSLGSIANSLPYSTLHALSSSGFVAVGAAFAGAEQDSTSQAVIWDSDHGMRLLKSVLTADGVPGLTNWRLVAAYGLSADGHTICGLGVNPSGVYQAFQATIPYTVGPNLTALSVSPTAIVGGTTAIGKLTLSQAAPTGGLIVSLGSNSSSIKVPATVTVTAGSATATFAVTASAVTSPTNAVIGAAYKAVSLTTPATVEPKGVASLALTAATIYSGQTLGYNIVLATPAPTGGSKVTIQIGSATSFTLTVPAGQTSASVTNGLAESAANESIIVTASYDGTSATAPLTILAPIVSSVSVLPVSIKGGASFSITVTLTGFAPPSNLSVTLQANSSKVKITSPVKFSHGSSRQVVTATSTAVGSTTKVTITAAVNSSSKICTLTLTH